MSVESARAAGWYDDEADAAVLRYWNGRAWSPHTAPRPADAAVAPLSFTPDLFAPASDSIGEAPTLRLVNAGATRGIDEHTTQPVPPEYGSPAASTRQRNRVVWIVTGAVLAFAITIIVLSVVVALTR